MKRPPQKPATGVVLVASGKFLIRSVPLAAGAPVADQVDLALEGLSPFPLSQLYYGHAVDVARGRALVFAAYRRNFSADETAAWAEAAAVMPRLALWCGEEQAPGAVIRLWHDGDVTELAAWDGQSSLPALVQARRADPEGEPAWISEVRQRLGLPENAPVERLGGTVAVWIENRRLVVGLEGAARAARFDSAAVDALDVRDKGVLMARRAQVRRDRLWWGAFAGVLAGLAACVVLEGGLLGLRAWLAAQREALGARAPAAARIEAAQDLAIRLEQMATQRVMPFEMLAAINDRRPRTVEFTRVATAGLWRMDIEAQTVNAGDLRDFEAELRRLEAVARVAVQDSRTRDGLTTFRLEVEFKPGWARSGGGA